MTVKVHKPKYNLKEKLDSNNLQTGQAGRDTLKSENMRELFSNTGTSRKNILINGGFDVWQRATYFAATSGYFGPDQWFSAGAAAGFIAQRLASVGTEPFASKYYTRVQMASSNTNINQNIEHTGRYMADKYVTLSFWAKSDKPVNWKSKLISGTQTELASRDSYAGMEWTYNEITFPPFSYADWGNDVAKLYFGREFSEENARLDIAEVQLEIGSQATPFERLPIYETLLNCYRYCYVLTDDGSTTNFGIGTVEGTAIAAIGLGNFPVQMYSVPTVATNSGVSFYSPTTGSRGFSVTSNRSSTAQGALFLTITSAGASPGESCSLFNNGSGGKVTFEAKIV
jgi:hypothetical protein